MAKLSHDYIRFVLQMDASQHEQEIRKLTKNTQSLKEENKQLKKSMADLTADPFYGSPVKSCGFFQ